MVKALIRNDGETVRETDGIDGIDWNTGAPLTNEDWCGGAYTLVDGYTEQDATEQIADTPKVSVQEQIVKTYTIDGKEYTKEQVLNMLN